jgi:hypothetical protein
MSPGLPSCLTNREGRTEEEIPMNIKTDPLTAARAEALFTSRLTTGSRPAYDIAAEAIRVAVRARGGVRACAAEVAAEYGDHPELAVPRMQWARGVVEHLYGVRRAHTGRSRRSGWALVA